MTPDSCDRCGHKLPNGGATLFAAVPLTDATKLGRYGPKCARMVVLGRLEISAPTYNSRGRRITLDLRGRHE
jgi:hypothetical protein